MKHVVLTVLFTIGVTAFLLNRRAEKAEQPQEIRRTIKEISSISLEPDKTPEAPGAKRSDPATHKTEPLEASEWFAMIQEKRKRGLAKAEYLSAWSDFARANPTEALKAWAKFNYPSSRDLADVAEVIAEVLRERSAQDIANLLTPGLSEEQRGFLSGVVISEMPLSDDIRVWETMSDKLGSNVGSSVQIAKKLIEFPNKEELLQQVISSKNLPEAQVSAFVQNICQWTGGTDSTLINTLLATLENDPSATGVHQGLEKGLNTLDFSYDQSKKILDNIMSRKELDFDLGRSLSSSFGRWTLKAPIAASEFLSQSADSPNAEYIIAGFVQAYKEIDPAAAEKWLNTIKSDKIRDLAISTTIYQK